VQAASDELQFWINKGRYYTRYLENSDYALDCYNKALVIDPNNPSLRIEQASAAYFSKKYDEALSSIDKVLAIIPNNLPAMKLAFTILVRMKRFHEAIERCDNALAVDPNNETFYIQKGLSLDNLKKYNEAIKCYDRAIKIKTTDPYIWFLKGSSYSMLRKYDKALQSFDRSLEINPLDTTVLERRCEVLSLSGRHKEAEECYKKIGQDGTDTNAWTLFIKGFKSNNNRQYNEALELFSNALQFKPNDSLLWLMKGRVLHNMEKYQEAIECFDTALTIKPDDPQNNFKFAFWKDDWENRLKFLAWHAKGDCYQFIGRLFGKGESVDSYDKAVELAVQSTGNIPEKIQAWNDSMNLSF